MWNHQELGSGCKGCSCHERTVWSCSFGCVRIAMLQLLDCNVNLIQSCIMEFFEASSILLIECLESLYYDCRGLWAMCGPT